MKKILYLGLVAVLFFGVSLANATTFQVSEDSYVLGVSETVGDNLYAAGGNVNVAGTVDGDLLTAGGNVFVTGNVEKDASIVGGSINVQGDIGEDLRVAGGDVTVSGNIGGEMVSASGQLVILPGTTIGGDATLNGGYVVMNASVDGDVIVNGGEVYIDGLVDGNVEVRAETITLGPNAVISGNFDYYSESEAKIDEKAVISGEKTFHETERTGEKREGFLGFLAGFALFKSIVVSVAALILTLLWKKWTGNFVLGATDGFWKMSFYGFASFFLTPIAGIILLFTVFGMIPAFLIFLSYFAGLIFALVLSGILVVGLINKYIFKESVRNLSWWRVILGVFVFQLIVMIPYIGWLAAFAIFLTSLGWLCKTSTDAILKLRK